MEQKEKIKWKFFLLLSLITFQSYGTSSFIKETHSQLMEVNKNWNGLENYIEYSFSPTSEKELIQLHLLNVVSYLQVQPITELNKIQRKNRLFHISVLHKYCRAGNFPLNSLTSYRTPIFIDNQNTHCAVGYLMKENGLGKVAKEIAKKQLFAYLGDIEHPQFNEWQKDCGLSLFELALIQPAYGPPTLVCANPSPIEWHEVTLKNSGITQLYNNESNTALYGISNIDELGLKQEIKKYSSQTQEWKSIGSQINGQILDLVFCDDEIYISVLLPNENFPHQVLKLNKNKWEKAAHFNGNILSIQEFKNKLYVLGNFKKVNDSVTSNFVVINDESIKHFNPIGTKFTTFTHMKSSKTALFLVSYGGIYKFKNDSLNYLANILYHQYIKEFSLDVRQDTLYLTSLSIPGYYKYFNNVGHTSHMGNMVYGRDYPYNSLSFTKSKMINGKMIIAGDFKSSTRIPQINDNTKLIKCADSSSAHWFGEGLLYQYNNMYYPILKNGIVIDFVQLNNQIFILKKDGSIWNVDLNLIERKITQLRKRFEPLKQN